MTRTWTDEDARTGPGKPPVPRWFRAVAAVALLAWLAPSQAQAAYVVDTCMDCHADAPGQTFSLPDGTVIGIEVTDEEWKGSIHAEELGCTDCHTNFGEPPHPKLTDPDRRSYRMRQAETCKRCHYAHYTRALDGIHYKQLADGDDAAPTCVDCHGAHDTKDPHADRVSIDKKCGACHEEIAAKYEQSVHGKALIEDGNPDVPVCTDCHGAHDIQDPKREGAHESGHAICAKCHGDAERMKKYDLNPNVVDSYLDDFHGRSNAMYAQGAGLPGKPMATCTDCHGIHDIPSFREMDDSEAIRARVIAVCQDCHEETPVGFEDAWLSHYTPTLSSAPLVWAVTWFYRIIIPLMLVAFALHILLHLWRVRMHR